MADTAEQLPVSRGRFAYQITRTFFELQKLIFITILTTTILGTMWQEWASVRDQ
jgi:hypothetical protein